MQRRQAGALDRPVVAATALWVALFENSRHMHYKHGRSLNTQKNFPACGEKPLIKRHLEVQSSCNVGIEGGEVAKTEEGPINESVSVLGRRLTATPTCLYFVKQYGKRAMRCPCLKDVAGKEDGSSTSPL